MSACGPAFGVHDVEVREGAEDFVFLDGHGNPLEFER